VITPALGVALLTAGAVVVIGLLVGVAVASWRRSSRQQAERVRDDLAGRAYAEGYHAGRGLPGRETATQRPLAAETRLLVAANGDQPADVVRLVELLERVDELAVELRLCADLLQQTAQAGLDELQLDQPRRV
jgi:hypothetical protein